MSAMTLFPVRPAVTDLEAAPHVEIALQVAEFQAVAMDSVFAVLVDANGRILHLGGGPRVDRVAPQHLTLVARSAPRSTSIAVAPPADLHLPPVSDSFDDIEDTIE